MRKPELRAVGVWGPHRPLGPIDCLELGLPEGADLVLQDLDAFLISFNRALSQGREICILNSHDPNGRNRP